MHAPLASSQTQFIQCEPLLWVWHGQQKGNVEGIKIMCFMVKKRARFVRAQKSCTVEVLGKEAN